MKSRNKIKFMFFILALILLINLNFVIADFRIGNKSSEIEDIYQFFKPLRGWINISLQNQPDDSLLTALGYNITIKDFLDKDSADYSCFPDDCQLTYSTLREPIVSKNFLINERMTKTIGIKLTGYISEIVGISFNISTNAGKSCLNPVKIDIIDDGLWEWKSEKISDSFCYIEKPFGCFEQNKPKNSTILTENTLYCEKIKIPPVKGFLIGAIINGTGNAAFKILIRAGINEKECEVSVNSSGEVKCKIELNEELEAFTESEVCLQPLNANSYTISYENNEPCGYVGENTPDTKHDFEIFAKPLKYDSIRSVRFNQDLIGNEISLGTQMSDYISREYSGNCTRGCIIPIRIYSGINQNLTIFNLLFEYKMQGLQQTQNNFYEIQAARPLITSNFQKLDLEKANFLTPSSNGSRTVEIKLNDERILEKNITIRKGLEIKDILPRNAAALIPATFIVIMEGNATGLKYTWNFGNNTPDEITDKNYIKHTFPGTGTYQVKLKVSKDSLESSKTINVKVETPKEAIAKTLKEYRDSIKNISSEINKLPDWLRNQIKGDGKPVDIDSLNADLKKIDETYKDSIGEEYTKVMRDLLNLKIPYKVSVSDFVKPVQFFQTTGQIDFSSLEALDAGKPDENKIEEYPSAINSWIKEKLNTSIDSKTYTIYYKNGMQEILFSDVKLILEPKETIKELYVIINGNPLKIKFNGEFKTKDIEEGAVGVILEELSEPKTIEFLHPEKINLMNLPVFISSNLGDVEVAVVTGKCNHNKICEEGEDYKNCRSDCKPWKQTIIWLLILFFAAFAIYIVMQEWYKKYYESYLFSNKTQLFNLINFMYNSSNQGISKAEIFSKLRDYKWAKEQLEYAWRKFKGHRTGMLEIPVFKWVENKRVREEIAKRKGSRISTPYPQRK